MCVFGTSKPPRGAALVIAMLVMAVLLMAGTTFLTISSTESQIALNQRAAAQASLLAEAAIHKTLAQLNDNPGYTGETDTALGAGTFTITATTTFGCSATSARSLVATASVPVRGGNAQVVLQATADQVSYPFRWGAFAAVPNTVIQDDRIEKELWIKHDGSTDSFDSSLGSYDATTNRGKGGDIGGNADVTLDDSVQVWGNVRAGDAIHNGSGVTVTGAQTDSLSPNLTSPGEPLPSVTPGTTPTTGLIVTSGTYTLTAGTYYYTSLTMSSNTTLATSGGPVTVYVTGAVSIGNSVTIGTHPGTQLQIITKSDGTNSDFTTLAAGDNFTLYGSLYGKNTNITLGNDSRTFGSVIGRIIRMGDRSAVHFDQAISRREVCHNGKYNIRLGTWREVTPS